MKDKAADELDDACTNLHEHDLQPTHLCPEIYDAIVECTAFVNYRRMEVGESPVLLLSFHKKNT